MVNVISSAAEKEVNPWFLCWDEVLKEAYEDETISFVDESSSLKEGDWASLEENLDTWDMIGSPSGKNLRLQKLKEILAEKNLRASFWKVSKQNNQIFADLIDC